MAQGKRVLIVGAGDAGNLILREMLSNRLAGYTPIGLIDDDRNKLRYRFQGVKVLGVVLLDREEEGVAGRPPVAVAKAAEPGGILAGPRLHPRPGDVVGHAPSPRLEVIGDGEQQVHRLARPGPPPPG